MNASESPSGDESRLPGETSSGLLRVLGPGMAMAMVIGNVIGAGIFLKPSEAARAAGSFPIIFAAWTMGGVISILGALCLAELGVMLPRAGGLYVYLREAYGKMVAFVFCWSEFVFGRPASIGAISMGIVFQYGVITDHQLGNWESVALSLLVVAGLTAINVLGVIWGGRVQGGTTLIKAGFLLILALLPLLLIGQSESGVSTENYSTQIEPAKSTLPQQFAFALLAVLWAYNGWHAVTPVAEEVREPRRNIPLALFGGLGILILLYLGVNLAYHFVLTMPEVEKAGIAIPQEMIRKLLNPVSKSLADWGILIVSLAAICSMLGSMNTNLMNGPRVLFAMSRDNSFFHPISGVHPRFHTPWIAILIQGGMAALLITISAALISLNLDVLKGRNVFDILTDYVIVIASIFFMLAVGAVIVLRKKHPEWERPYRTWGYPVVPIAYLVINAWFLAYIVTGKLEESLAGIALSVIAIPLYYFQRSLSQRKAQ